MVTASRGAHNRTTKYCAVVAAKTLHNEWHYGSQQNGEHCSRWLWLPQSGLGLSCPPHLTFTETYFANGTQEIVSVVTKAVASETEAKTEAAGSETEAKTEAEGSETEAKTEAEGSETEDEAQGSWLIF